MAALSLVGAREFSLDASSDSLVLDGDVDLAYAEEIGERYGGGDPVIVTYSPAGDLLGPDSLAKLAALRSELSALPRVASVTTLLDVPLLRNPPVPLSDLQSNLKTLEDPAIDIELAREELRTSPLYQGLLVSEDLRSTVLEVTFQKDVHHAELARRVDELQALDRRDHATPLEMEELAILNKDYARSKNRRQDELEEDIAAIRGILDAHRGEAQLFLGGVPMIVNDIVAYIRSDIVVFGVGILSLLGATLFWAFRRRRWVVMPLLCCFYSGLTMVGFLGWLGWPVTVVSSNFISLQLIFTLSLAIHIIVRCLERMGHGPEISQRELIRETVGHTFVPCLYASLTTIAGFSSLVLCDILPVSSFGRMMTMGVLVSLLATFVLFPAALMIVKPLPFGARERGRPHLTAFFARLTEHRGKAILVVSTIVLVLTAVGVQRLRVENSFIDYFKKDSEIYQGMAFIDQNLGGTTPLDVVLDFPAQSAEELAAAEEGSDPATIADEDLDDFDDFDDFDSFEEEGEEDTATYWFTTTKLDRISRVHRYLDEQPEVGKVLSLSTLRELGREANGGEPLDDLLLAVLFQEMPDLVKDVLVDPYVSVDDSQARINMRIKDSMEGIERDPFLRRVREDLGGELGLDEEEFHVSGLMVLYNNMLQSLFKAQISTVGYTITALLLMFWLLFRSLKIALIAIMPSLLSSLTVLGVMGLAGIPLDVMTITIVAISTGIAVDDTIHYLHRFKHELAVDGDYLQSMHRCHRSIGSAMYFTTLAITLGFSILALSSFVPSILFGLFTALAMVMALVSSLTLLPRLVIALRPFGDPTGARS